MVQIPDPTGPLLLRIPEAARRLGLAPRTVWALIAAGKLDVVRMGRRATRVTDASVTAYIELARRSEGAR
ncbi:MAG: helix-turn-helix transcriptional regulator [Planctomycetota bacterium]